MILSSVADRNGIGHGEELVCKRLETAKTPPLLIRRTRSFPTEAMNRHLGVIDGGSNFQTNFRMKARKKLGGERRAGFVKIVASARGLAAQEMNNACYRSARSPERSGSTNIGSIQREFPFLWGRSSSAKL